MLKRFYGGLNAIERLIVDLTVIVLLFYPVVWIAKANSFYISMIVIGCVIALFARIMVAVIKVIRHV